MKSWLVPLHNQDFVQQDAYTRYLDRVTILFGFINWHCWKVDIDDNNSDNDWQRVPRVSNGTVPAPQSAPELLDMLLGEANFFF